MTAKPQLIETDTFRAFFFPKPPRLEAAVAFDADHFSQKLVFRVMDITHKHGFACSAPQFGRGESEGKLVFCVGIPLASKRSLPKALSRMGGCLAELAEFHAEFLRQMDFSRLDLSMFQGSPEDLDPAFMATVRDQHYGGSWDAFRDDMVSENRREEAEIVERCRLFEKANGKDIAFVGDQLEYMLSMIGPVGEREAN